MAAPTVPHQAETVRFIVASTVQSGLYGFNFGFYLLCARSLYLQLKCRLDLRRKTLIMLLHMSLVMICGLLGLATDAHSMKTSYLDHANYPGGSFAYWLEVFTRSRIAIMGYVMSMIIDILTLGIQIWRLWIIWKASQYRLLVVAVPILSLLVIIAIELTQLILLYFPKHLTVIFIKFLLSGYESFGLSVTTSVTIFIVIRIAVVRRRHINLMGQSDAAGQYTSIISMLIESFSLEFLWMVTLTFTEIKYPKSGTSEFFILTQPFIQTFAYLLVIYRVTTGRGWKEDTEQKLTTLEWNRDEPQISSRLSDTVTRASLPVQHEEA